MRRRGRIESNVNRAPVWDVGNVRPDPAPITARSLLGADLTVTASRRLSMRDLAVLAAGTERLVDGNPPEAPTTLHNLGAAVYGREPQGKDRRDLVASLDRLVEITLEIPGFDVTRNRIVGNLAGKSKANLLEAVFVESDTLELVIDRDGRREVTDPRAVGRLRGTANVRIRFAWWYAEQIRAGNVTYLDLALFRRLRSGLAARLWAYLEGERYEQKGGARESKSIGLGEPLLAALDLLSYGRENGRERDRWPKLRAACAKVVAADPRYETLELRPGVAARRDLYVVRRTSAADVAAEARRRAEVRDIRAVMESDPVTRKLLATAERPR